VRPEKKRHEGMGVKKTNAAAQWLRFEDFGENE